MAAIWPSSSIVAGVRPSADDRIEHRELLRRGHGEQVRQAGDVFLGVVGQRIGGAQSLRVGRLGIREQPLQVAEQARANRPQHLAEQRLVLGVGRDELPGHELQVRLGPPRRVGRGNVAGQSQRRAEPPLWVRFLIAQQAAEPLDEPGRVGTKQAAESARRTSRCP